MEVNRFFKPTPMPIMNTYVPIDFSTLLQVGRELRQLVDLATKELNEQIMKFGEFQSPSETDTLRWYDNTIGKFSDLLDEAASNPDAMKDANFRALINSRLANLDYGYLSRMKLTADNSKARLAMIALMKSKGLYNLNWDPMYNEDAIRRWDTANQGIMDNLAPIEYKSLLDLVKPYVDNIKPTFYKKNPLTGEDLPYTNWMAISNDELQRELTTNFNTLKNTPQGSLWYNDIARAVKASNPNATEADYDRAFMLALMTESSYKLQATPVVDQATLSMQLAAIKKSAAGSTNDRSTLTRVTANQVGVYKQVNQYYDKLRDDMAKKMFGKPFDKLDENDQMAIGMNVLAEVQRDGINKHTVAQMPANEFYEHYQQKPSVALKIKGGDEEWNTDKPGTLGIPYSYAPHDQVFNSQGKAVSQITSAFVKSSSWFGSDKLLANPTVYIDDVLNALSESAIFSAGDKAMPWNYSDNWDPNQNGVLHLGKLYVTEDMIEKAIEKTHPDMVDELMDLFTEGYKDSQSGKTYYKILEEVPDARIDSNDDDDVYAITLGRPYGNTFNMNFGDNRMYEKEVVGTTNNANETNAVISQSNLAATKYETPSNFD